MHSMMLNFDLLMMEEMKINYFVLFLVEILAYWDYLMKVQDDET